MATRIADTLKPMGNFPAAKAQDVWSESGESLESTTAALYALAASALAKAKEAQTAAEDAVNKLVYYNSYSLDETFSGAYWIDGRKIYKKTYDMGTIPAPTSTGTSAFLRIPFEVEFDTVVGITGIIMPNEESTVAQYEWYSIPKPPKVGSSSYNVSLKIKPYNNVLNLELETKDNTNNKKAVATVFYVKNEG